MSRCTLDQYLVLFDATVISPFGITCTWPSRSRSTVRRRFIDSTSPDMPAIVTTSPVLYWFSASMNIPAIRSRTRYWAPKPTAIPAIPNPPRTGPMGTDSSVSTMNNAETYIRLTATPTNTLDSVCDRFITSSRSAIEAWPSMIEDRALGITRFAIRVATQLKNTIIPIRRPSVANQLPVVAPAFFRKLMAGSMLLPSTLRMPRVAATPNTAATRKLVIHESAARTAIPTSAVASC